MRSAMLVAVLAFALGGCSSNTAPSLSQLDGRWSEVYTIAGFSTTMDLRTIGTTVSGVGEWCGEALRCGTLTVTGALKDNTLHLALSFDNGNVLTFDGRMSGIDSLVGSAKWAVGVPESFEVTFNRA
jgi:hypothetical protein